MRVVLSPRAQRDLDEAADYLIEQSPSAARKFADAIEAALTRLADNPMIGAPTDYKDYRAYTMRSFRYRLFYRLDGDLAIIETIFHTSLDPDEI